jgi:uncharacterized protein (TIGR00369 family)
VRDYEVFWILLQVGILFKIKVEGKSMRFESNGNCFVCGMKNPDGLKLHFEIDPQRKTLKTTFISPPSFQGWDGLVHGGIIATLLDEAMAKLSYELGYDAVTASLEIKFKKPAPILEPLEVYGEIVEIRKRWLRAKATLKAKDGTLLAEGRSTLMRTSSPIP